MNLLVPARVGGWPLSRCRCALRHARCRCVARCGATRLRRSVVQQLSKRGQQRLVGCEAGRLPGDHLVHQRADRIQRGVDRVAYIRGDLALALAYRAEYIFDAMRDLLDLGLAGGPRAALEAMRLTEEPIEQRLALRTSGLALQFEQHLRGCLTVLGLLLAQ